MRTVPFGIPTGGPATRPVGPSAARQFLAVGTLVALVALTACGGESGGGESPDDLAPRDVGVGQDTGAGIDAMTTEMMPPESMEGLSLLGDTLWRPAPSASVRPRLEAQLDSARAALANAPSDADSIIWVGRRLAYLGRYQEAIGTFTRGIAEHPADARLLRHRGHRFLTVREIEPAIDDFTKAAQLEAGKPDAIEPDGAPNAANIPLSTTQFNIWYHLGLAHFVRGNWEEALKAYDACLAVSTNPDLQVATAYWRYMTLRRLGRDAEASESIVFAGDSLTLLENGTYLTLLRLFRGDVTVEEALPPTPAGEMDVANSTLAFGVSMWHALNGRPAEAAALQREILAGGQWAAFGSLAAEAELARGE